MRRLLAFLLFFVFAVLAYAVLILGLTSINYLPSIWALLGVVSGLLSVPLGIFAILSLGWAITPEMTLGQAAAGLGFGYWLSKGDK